MEKHLEIGSYTWNNIPGKIVLEISDTAPLKHAPAPTTVRQLKELQQQLGGHLVDPISKQPYTLDLGHLHDDTQLWMTWLIVADEKVHPSDPRHPRNYQGNIEDLIV